MNPHHFADAIYLLGIMCIAGPALIAMIEGVRADEDDESDFISWMMGKRLDQIFTMQAIMMVGLLLMTIGVVMGVQP